MKKTTQTQTLLDELITDMGLRRFPGAAPSLRRFMRKHGLSESTDLKQLTEAMSVWSAERKARLINASHGSWEE